MEKTSLLKNDLLLLWTTANIGMHQGVNWIVFRKGKEHSWRFKYLFTKLVINVTRVCAAAVFVYERNVQTHALQAYKPPLTSSTANVCLLYVTANPVLLASIKSCVLFCSFI